MTSSLQKKAENAKWLTDLITLQDFFPANKKTIKFDFPGLALT
jgi:hypothetical protein